MLASLIVQITNTECALQSSDVILPHYLTIDIPYSGKVWRGKVWWKKVWWMNRSANMLLIVNTNLNGFSLWFSLWFYICTSCILNVVSFHLAQSTPSSNLGWLIIDDRAMVAGNASQTTPVQIMYIFVLCCTTQNMHVQFWFL